MTRNWSRLLIISPTTMKRLKHSIFYNHLLLHMDQNFNSIFIHSLTYVFNYIFIFAIFHASTVKFMASPENIFVSPGTSVTQEVFNLKDFPPFNTANIHCNEIKVI